MGKFVISTRKNGEFQFNLQASNGQIILSSEGYTSKSACQNGVDAVRKNASNDSLFERKTASNGKFHFNLKSTNGQVIGTSQMYESEAGMENGISSVQQNATNAILEEV